MSEIPEDIRIEAGKLAHDFSRGFLDGGNFEGAVGYAILAERERATARINHLHSALESIRLAAEPYSSQVAAVALIGKDDWE